MDTAGEFPHDDQNDENPTGHERHESHEYPHHDEPEGHLAGQSSATTGPLELDPVSWAPAVFEETGHKQRVDYTPVKLSRMELKTLAYLHLNRLHEFQAFLKQGGSGGSSDHARALLHEARYEFLLRFLPEGDRQEFQELCRQREVQLMAITDPEEELV